MSTPLTLGALLLGGLSICEAIDSKEKELEEEDKNHIIRSKATNENKSLLHGTAYIDPRVKNPVGDLLEVYPEPEGEHKSAWISVVKPEKGSDEGLIENDPIK